MQELNIRKVLTCSAMPIRKNDQLSAVDYKFVFMMDMVSQDILGNGLLEECLRYIASSVREGNNVLVHCEVGVSRSVTVVAAYVMRHFEWSAEKALMFIQKARPIACPNQSFIQQLSIFEQMGYRADSRALTQSQLYRNYCADTGNIPAIGTASSMLAAKISGKTVSSSNLKMKAMPRLAALSRNQIPNDPSGNMQSTKPSSSASTSRNLPTINTAHPAASQLPMEDPEQMAQQSFRCRKCRQQLFYDLHIMHHTKGGFNQAKQPYSADSFCDFEYLLMPMKWMSTAEFQGKINCPKCGEKLGQYIWGGRVCLGNGDGKQCGAFVAPWIHIQKCKVDMSRIGA
uniref:protein-tyrosine-phosphatase n=1 Tax=Ditylenchus dipsaci TaxID=166011 RepID=A0A915DSD4_9BILA